MCVVCVVSVWVCVFGFGVCVVCVLGVCVGVCCVFVMWCVWCV